MSWVLFLAWGYGCALMKSVIVGRNGQYVPSFLTAISFKWACYLDERPVRIFVGEI